MEQKKVINFGVFFVIQEFADALREFTPNKDGAKDAEQMASGLEEMKQTLEKQRREQEQKLKKEHQGKYDNNLTLTSSKDWEIWLEGNCLRR